MGAKMSEAIQEYRRTAEQARRDELVLTHLSLVRHVLGRLLYKLPPGMDRENLEAAGVLGLVEAAARYDPTRNVNFSSFAYRRVQGAILDELRRNSVFPQHVLERMAMVREARRRLPNPVTFQDLMIATGLSEEDLADTLAAMRLSRTISWEGLADDGSRHPQAPAETALEELEELRLVSEAIESLPERERTIITLYFRDDLRLREIAEIVGLSVSRVSRVIQSTLHDLAEMLHARGIEIPLTMRWRVT
jgi:RNA polymerase sigma factor for flagellar operon FliA